MIPFDESSCVLIEFPEQLKHIVAVLVDGTWYKNKNYVEIVKQKGVITS